MALKVQALKNNVQTKHLNWTYFKLFGVATWIEHRGYLRCFLHAAAQNEIFSVFLLFPKPHVSTDIHKIFLLHGFQHAVVVRALNTLAKLNLFQTLLIPTVLRQNPARCSPKGCYLFTVFCKAIAENTGIYNVLTHCMHKIVVNTSNLLSPPCCFGTWEFSSFFGVFELVGPHPQG